MEIETALLGFRSVACFPTLTLVLQFEANNGYCGEVSVMSTASALGGTWMSQYNARAVCGASLSLVGSPGATLASVLPPSPPGPVPSG